MSQEKCQEMPELNLERIIEYLAQNNLPLNLEHVALKNESSAEQETLIDSKLESTQGELRLKTNMDSKNTKDKMLNPPNKCPITTKGCRFMVTVHIPRAA